MVECNETDKKLVLWKKLSAYATETLKELDISEVDLSEISLNELLELIEEFFKCVAENHISTVIVNELTAKMDNEKSDLDFIDVDETGLNIPAEIADAGALLGANVSSSSYTQQDVVTKIEQMKTRVDCPTLISENDTIVGELENIDEQFFARKEEQVDQLENQLVKLKETLHVEKESLESSRKAGQDINQTKFLIDEDFVVYSSLRKNFIDITKNLD